MLSLIQVAFVFKLVTRFHIEYDQVDQVLFTIAFHYIHLDYIYIDLGLFYIHAMN